MKIKVFICSLLLMCFSLDAAPTPPVSYDHLQVFVIDSDTDTVLFKHNSDQRMVPSSMTKILTAYILLKQIESGKITLETEFSISKKAWKTGGTKMYLMVDKTVSVRDLLQGLFVASANDACVCIAENISGSEEAFAELMNKTAAELGCKNSHFIDASGLTTENHYTTCEDLYIISKKLYDEFPQYKQYFCQKEFQFGKGLFKSLNRLLKTFEGADGLKTGHTKAGGYGVVTSASVNNQRVFVIFNGCKTMVERNRVSEALMRWSYSAFQQVCCFKKDEILTMASTWMAQENHLPLGSDKDILVTVPRIKDAITAELIYQGPLEPPLNKGEKVGELKITLPEGFGVKTFPVYALAPLNRASYLKRLPIILNYLIYGKSRP